MKQKSEHERSDVNLGFQMLATPAEALKPRNQNKMILRGRLLSKYVRSLMGAREVAKPLCFSSELQENFIIRRFKANSSECNETSSCEVSGAMSSKYEKFPDETDLVLDLELERKKKQILEKTINKHELETTNLKRGATGVFEIEELVSILQKEKAEDIFVVKVPSEHCYVDYLVTVTGRSTRHMLAISEFVRKIFKNKKLENDVIPTVEGKNSKNWMALDLGNIALHVFSKSGRELFDLESLWTLGKNHDPQCQEIGAVSENLVSDYSSLLSKLVPDTSQKN